MKPDIIGTVDCGKTTISRYLPEVYHVLFYQKDKRDNLLNGVNCLERELYVKT